MEAERPVNTDRGWGWVITAAVFVCNILCVGYFRAFGVFFVEIIETFHSTTSVTSLIMGINSAVFSVSALLVHNVLLQVVSERTSAMVGGCVMATGMMLSTFATSIAFLVFSLGVLVGLGNAMTYGPGLVLLGQYFERRRALAIAVASMGSSVGSMTLPLLATRLLQQYGLSGAWLLYGAVTLHLSVFASLYRPLEPRGRLQQSVDEEDSAQSLLSEKNEVPHIKVVPETGSDTPTQRDRTAERELSGKTGSVASALNKDGERTISRETQGGVYVKAQPYHALVTEEAARTFSSTGDVPSIQKAVDSGDIIGKRSLTVGDLRFDVKPRFSDHSLKNLTSVFQRKLLRAASHASHPHLMIHSSSYKFLNHEQDTAEADASSKHSDDTDTSKVRCRRTAFEKICDRELLVIPVFWLVLAYVCTGVLGASGGGLYLPSLCQERGLSKDDTAMVLTTWGAVNLVGRLLCGLVADRQWLSPPRISALAFFITGLLFQCLPLLPHTWAAMMAVGVVYGLFEGAYFTMLPIIIIQFLTLKHFSRTFGFAQLAQGAFATIIYPLLGKLRDETGNYHATFHTLGACALTACTLLLLEPVLRALTKRKKRKASASDLHRDCEEN